MPLKVYFTQDLSTTNKQNTISLYSLASEGVML